MTPAEFKTLREYLGLSGQWVASQLFVSLRTVQHWESGRNAVSEKAERLLEQIDGLFESKIGKALADAYELSASGEHQVSLFRYPDDESLWQADSEMQGIPSAAHASLLARIRRELLQNGFSVQINYPKNQDGMS